MKRDQAEAVRLYKLAAAQGDAMGKTAVAIAYHEGAGVPKDLKESFRLFRAAADQGYGLAQYNLGVLYGEGRGVAQDDVEAYVWATLSAAPGTTADPKEAAEYSRELEGRMSPTAVKRAKERLRERKAAIDNARSAEARSIPVSQLGGTGVR